MNLTLKKKTQLVVPLRIQRKARLKDGDQLEFKATPGMITIAIKPPAVMDDEYTPEQRRIINREIAKGLEDIRRGRTYGPFDTAEDAIKFLHKEIRARKGKDKRKTPQS